MQKKYKILILILAALIAIALALFFLLRPKLYHAERINPRTLHANETYHEMLVGLWKKDDNLYYRFYEDGTGVTWDASEDITESEASPFEWAIYDEAIMLTHKMLLRGVVPRYYHLDNLNHFDLRFHDSYRAYVMERIDSLLLIPIPPQI